MWQQVALPHEWPRHGAVTQGWYRFQLRDQLSHEQHAVYLWRFAMNAEVWLNDQFLGNGGSMQAPVARNWNRPLIFGLPKSAWRESNNYLYVRIATYPGWGSLPGVVVGPTRLLEPKYKVRYRLQVDHTEATFVISLIAIFFGLTLWATQPSAKVYLAFGLTCVAAAVFSSNLFLQHIPTSPRVWSWIVHAALDWYGVGFAIFGHRLLELETRKRDIGLLIFGLLATAVYGFFDLYAFLNYSSYVHAFSILLVVYLSCLAGFVMVRRPSVEAFALASCTFAMTGLAVHDFLLDSAQGLSEWEDNVYLLHYGFPVLIFIMVVVLTRQFARSLRVAARAEITVLEERDRVYADIHDDIGARLLSLVYTAENENQANIARTALGEVRTIIRGAMRDYDDLAALLLGCEAEARERCYESAVVLVWHAQGDLHRGFPRSHQYHLQRILRELVTNALKHSDCTAIEVEAKLEDERLCMEMVDCGVRPMHPVNPGSGMTSLKRRVREMAGSIDWQFESHQCRVNLTISAPNTRV